MHDTLVELDIDFEEFRQMIFDFAEENHENTKKDNELRKIKQEFEDFKLIYWDYIKK